MATWITHLRIAEAFLKKHPELDSQSFSIGNIAPDSGIPDAKWEHFIPDPKITHILSGQNRPHQLSENYSTVVDWILS